MMHHRREPVPGVFRLVLSLPFPGLRNVNAYLLEDESGSTLVDCGIYQPHPSGNHGWDDLVAALAAADAQPQDVRRLIVTHPHADHYGMAGRFVDMTSCELWMHADVGVELDLYRDPESARESVRATLVRHGVGELELDEITAFEDWRPFVSRIAETDHPVTEGETVTVAERTWTVLHTPGHSRSHICLWSESDGILISGDHLLPAITPHIDLERGPDDDPLGEFLVSLEKIEELEPELVLPGHGRPFDDGAQRARVNARHHDRRLGSILQVIRNDPKTANEITDAIFGQSLLNFEKRLALGEALAHLAYLLRRGEVEKLQSNGVFRYRKTAGKRVQTGV